MKNRVRKNHSVPTTVSNTPRGVTFVVPGHLADLIDETRRQSPGQWEKWLLVPAYQSLARPSLEECHAEFESLLDTTGKFDFEDDGKREAFMAPLLAALDRAYTAERSRRAARAEQTPPASLASNLVPLTVMVTASVGRLIGDLGAILPEYRKPAFETVKALLDHHNFWASKSCPLDALLCPDSSTTTRAAVKKVCVRFAEASKSEASI